MVMYLFAFEKLEVWQEARILVKHIYQLTEKFPAQERFGLTSQVRRAAISVAANLAEGSARFSAKEQAHFYSLAYGSLVEVLSHIIVAVDLDFAEETDLSALRKLIQPLSLKINNLRNRQRSH